MQERTPTGEASKLSVGTTTTDGEDSPASRRSRKVRAQNPARSSHLAPHPLMLHPTCRLLHAVACGAAP